MEINPGLNKTQHKLVEPKQEQILNWKDLVWTCFYCREDFQQLKHFRAHQKSAHQVTNIDITRFLCNDCQEPLLGYTSYLNHVRKKHYDILKFCCDICNEVLSNCKELAEHRENHMEFLDMVYPIIYHCPLCESVHPSERQVISHVHNEHKIMTPSEANEERIISPIVLTPLNDNPTIFIPNQIKEEFDETQVIYNCGVCAQSFNDETAFNMHVKKCRAPFTCIYCDKYFFKKTGLISHLVSHSTERPFKCELCPKTFKVAGMLKSHMTSHTDERPYECDICKKKFKAPRHIKSHLKTHSRERPHQCSFCDMNFKSRTHLKAHEMIHTNIGPKVCKICSKAFQSEAKLKSHSYIHTNERPYKCEVCDRRFKHEGAREEHMHVHSDERPHNCEICDKKFGSLRALKTHQSSHRIERQRVVRKIRCNIRDSSDPYKLPPLPRTSSGKIPTKKFKCEICNKALSSKLIKEAHLRIHKGERPFKCKICETVFTAHSGLFVHMQRHKKDKPRKCKFCKEDFPNTLEYRVHLRVHYNERKHKCNNCSKRFYHHSNLKYHLNKCKKEDEVIEIESDHSEDTNDDNTIEIDD